MEKYSAASQGRGNKKKARVSQGQGRGSPGKFFFGLLCQSRLDGSGDGEMMTLLEKKRENGAFLTIDDAWYRFMNIDSRQGLRICQA